MNLWHDMETVTLADVERTNLAIRHFGHPHAVSVGARRFTLQFEACRARYPLRVSGVAGQVPFSAGCDAGALLPELAPSVIDSRGDAALGHVADALNDWLCALEGLFGFTIELTGVAFDGVPEQGAYGLAVTHTASVAPPIFRFLARRSMHGCNCVRRPCRPERRC